MNKLFKLKYLFFLALPFVVNTVETLSDWEWWKY
ncbi:hypothetical protein J2T50_002084 [Streptococcus gallinaceus]|uniref:Uncharacterized protein n=1 Tax=Streptococcus gallinaceus TaxID=165758 RepID=A0ABV2JR71_9STRE|nr:hypothetical protein [Streptococcus gallinaceus]MCP1771131.1 hypothetical protein [Streptococcus gallinaceus]